MNPRPVIFLSAVSKELKTARGHAARLLHSMGYDPKDQDMARTEHGSLRAVLRKWIDQSEGIIQLVGQCYGAEPHEADGVTPKPDPELGRCSYTQFEALYARKTGKPIWYFFVAVSFPADAHEPEPDDLRELQRAYRETILATGDLRHSFMNDAELENGIRRIEDYLDELRSEWRDERRRVQRFRVFAGTGILLLLIIGLVLWQIAARIEKKMTALAQAGTEFIQRNAAEIPAAESIQRNLHETPAADRKDEAERRTFLVAELEKKYGLTAGTLAKELPEMARKRAEDTANPKMERAKAAFAALNYTEAERLALEASTELKNASLLDKHKLIQALEFAGWSASAGRNYPNAGAHFTEASKWTDKTSDPVEWARVHYGLAEVKNDRTLLHEVIAIQTEKLGAEHPDTLRSRTHLAISLDYQGQMIEAIAHSYKLAREDPTGQQKLALETRAKGIYAEAEAELRAVLPGAERALGADHPDLALTCYHLASNLKFQKRFSEALDFARRALAIRKKVLPEGHPDTKDAQALLDYLEMQ